MRARCLPAEHIRQWEHFIRAAATELLPAFPFRPPHRLRASAARAAIPFVPLHMPARVTPYYAVLPPRHTRGQIEPGIPSYALSLPFSLSTSSLFALHFAFFYPLRRATEYPTKGGNPGQAVALNSASTNSVAVEFWVWFWFTGILGNGELGRGSVVATSQRGNTSRRDFPRISLFSLASFLVSLVFAKLGSRELGRDSIEVRWDSR